MSELTLDVGLAYKIKQALSRNGITDVADLDWLVTGMATIPRRLT